MDEFKRVSSEKDNLKKQFDEAEKERASLKEEVAALKANKTEAAEDGEKTQDTDKGEDMFSYDDEIPQLQAEVATKSEEVTKLTQEVTSLKGELSVAKEHSTELVQSLERATRELSEVREKGAVQESLQTQLEARDTEITAITGKLKKAQSDLHELENKTTKASTDSDSAIKEQEEKLKKSIEYNEQVQGELKKVADSKSSLEKKVKELSTEIDALKKSKTESEEKVQMLEKDVENASKAAPAPATDSLQTPISATATAGGAKKKNKKKKKGGSATNGDTITAGTSEKAPASPLESPDTEALRAELESLKAEISDKDARIERLSRQRKTEEDLREEIENLQENLINIGQDHVEDKEKIKTLEGKGRSYNPGSKSSRRRLPRIVPMPRQAQNYRRISTA